MIIYHVGVQRVITKLKEVTLESMRDWFRVH